MDTKREAKVEDLAKDMRDSLSPEALKNFENSDDETNSRVARCAYILENINHAAVAERGEEHAQHVEIVGELVRMIGLGEMRPESITPSMHLHLEELFVITQDRYNLSAEEEEKIREMCAKNGVPIDE